MRAFHLLALSAPAAARVRLSVWVWAGLLVLVVLSLPASVVVSSLPSSLGPPLGTPMAIPLFLMLSIALAIAALLLSLGLNLYRVRQGAGPADSREARAQRRVVGRAAAVSLLLSALLVAKALYNLYWLHVWDGTYDPIEYARSPLPILVAVISGCVLSSTLPGRTKLAGFLYLLLVPALMITVATYAQSVDYRRLTEERAERVVEAVESYHARKGRYPQDLRQLTPWHAVSLPGPVIIFGQNWCYDGGDDYYRLGYVDREHWNAPPTLGRVYKTKGDVLKGHGICDEEIAALRKRYPYLFHEDTGLDEQRDER